MQGAKCFLHYYDTMNNNKKQEPINILAKNSKFSEAYSREATKIRAREEKIIPLPEVGAELESLNTNKRRLLKDTEKVEALHYIETVADWAIDNAKSARNAVGEMMWTTFRKGLASCGSVYEYLYGLQTGTLYHVNAITCKSKFCPYCQWRAARKVEELVNKALDKLQAQKISRDKTQYSLVGITLTVQNCTGADLKETVDTMLKAWDKLMDRKAVKAICKGYIRNLEITRNINKKSAWYGTFHPHIHAVMLVNNSYFTNKAYISQSEWARLWSDAIGITTPAVSSKADAEAAEAANLPIVWVRKVKNAHQAVKYNVAGLYKHDDADDAKEGIMTGEKPFDAETIEWITDATAKRRLFSAGGRLKNIMSVLRNANTDEDEEKLTDELCAIIRGHREKDKIKIHHAEFTGKTVKEIMQERKAAKVIAADRKEETAHARAAQQRQEGEYNTLKENFEQMTKEEQGAAKARQYEAKQKEQAKEAACALESETTEDKIYRLIDKYYYNRTASAVHLISIGECKGKREAKALAKAIEAKKKGEI